MPPLNPNKPSQATLWHWRKKGVARAKAAGFHTACDLCKRPIAKAYRFGRVGLRPARAWRSKVRVRRICHGCYLVIQAMLLEMEINGARDHLPPEDYADVSAKKLAEIDSLSADDEDTQ